MSELTKKRVHWTEYNGDELLHDEDVDILTSADAVTFDDGEDLQYKYTQGQFVSPSVTGSLTNLGTTNKSTLVDAINEVKASATSNESSITSLTNRVSTNENDIDSLEKRVTPISLGGTGATSASGALSNLGITASASELNKLDGVTATTTELNYVDGVTSNIQTQLDGKASSSHNHSASNITSGTLAIARGGTGATTASAAIANLHGVESTTADITYYVSPSGSDSNNGTSNSKPFKTLAYALSKLPKYIAHNITVNLASGTYTEANVAIVNFTGPGKIVINGNTNSATSYYFENGISVKYLSCELNINGVSFGTASTDSGIDFMYCSGLIMINKCHAYEPSLTANDVIGFYVRTCSSVLFSECQATYFSRGFYSSENSQVSCRSCVCTNCTFPWNCFESSILFARNCSSSGYTSAANYSYAGLIVDNNGGVVN